MKSDQVMAERGKEGRGATSRVSEIWLHVEQVVARAHLSVDKTDCFGKTWPTRAEQSVPRLK